MIRRFRRLTLASAVLLLSTLSGCGFSHPLPLRNVYETMSVGDAVVEKLKLPADTKRVDDGLLTVLSRSMAWEHDGGSVERIVIVRDAAGAVQAKHYAVEGDEVSLATMTLKHIDHYEWALRSKDARLEDFQSTFLKMDNAALHAAAAEKAMDPQTIGDPDDDPDQKVPPWKPLLREYAAAGQCMPFDCRFRGGPKPKLLPVQFHYHIDSPRAGTVRLMVEQRVDVSIPVATAYGWGSVLTGHGLPY